MRPVDVAANVSPELSSYIQTLVEDPDREEEPTLEDVRAALREATGEELREVEALHPEDRTSMMVELDDLISEYGEDALAADFVEVAASEDLSRVIEAAMDDPSLPEEPTLALVREAMLAGLTARLAGDGTIGADEDATLLAEIEALIARYGDDALAEDFIRFE